MDYNSIYLVSLRLINFQSWEDCTISFKNGINVIVAPNNTGKSVVFKALSLTATPDFMDKETRQDFLRGYNLMGHMIYQFSDNSMYDVVFTEDSNYYYFIKDIENPTKELMGNQPPEDLINKLGITLRGKLIGNLIDFRKDMFLVDSDDSLDHSTLSLLITDNRTQHLKEELENDRIPRMKSIVKSLENKKLVMIESMGNFSYKDIDVEEKNLEYAEGLIKDSKPLVNLGFVLNTVRPFTVIDESILENIKTATNLYNVLNLFKSLNKPKEVQEVTKNIIKVSEVLRDLNVNLKEVMKLKYISINKFLMESKSLLRVLESKIEEVNVDNKTIETIEELMKLNKVLAESKNIEELGLEIEELKEELDSERGEIYDCPIHGRIKYIDQECIPYYE